MKQFLFAALLLTIISSTQAQHQVYDLMERTDLSLTEIKTRSDRYFDSAGTGRGTGYKQFQRWLYERKFHVDENGYFISPQTEWNNYLQARVSLRNESIQAGNWTSIGPGSWTYTSGWNPGTGRLAAMAVHPANQNIIYAGSPGGGLWKTTNAGLTWAPLTDNNSLWMSIFAITIDPVDQNIIYVGTSTSIILKSIDAGATWNQAGTGPGATIRKILIHPANSNIVFAAASNGIWRSTNAGASWSQVHTTSKEDIEFKTDDPNIMISSGTNVVRSTDNGLTWTVLGAADGITNTGRTLVAVSPDDPNVVYAVQASGSLFGRMYRSVNAGLSFTTTVIGNPASGTNYFGYETTGAGTGGQATYDMAMDVSPTNANDVYIAGIICWRSINGGNSFTPLTAWSYPNSIGYNHADVHGLFWVGNILYSISDGGLYKSIDNGDNWTDLSSGLVIRQFYRFANSQVNPNIITGGAQDNGSVTRQAAGNWADWLGADGMEGLVSPTNPLNIWGTSQNGNLYRSINGGASYTGLPEPAAGQWVTPLASHPTNESIIYGGWNGVYKSTTSGTSWTNLSAGVITSTLADLAVSPSNPNYIYASNGATLYVTTNDGATWATRSAPAVINDIAIDPTDPTKIWVALNSTANRVMVSTDAGATFTNISLNLPAIVARAVIVDENMPRGIYVGMNIGVYYKSESDPNWTDYSDNLPLVAINELEIQKATNKIRVATYGRSIWESPAVPVVPPSTFNFSTPAAAISACPAPGSMSITLASTQTGSFTTPIVLTATGNPPGTTVNFSPNPLTPGNSAVVSLTGTNTLSSGTYPIVVTGTAGSIVRTETLNFTINPGTGPVISTQPADQGLCATATATYSVTAASATTFQWQLSSDGGSTYFNITNGGVYSGATTNTLTITGVTAPMNNFMYRSQASTNCGTTISTAARLTINAPTVITSQAQDATLCTGSTASLCITATGTNLVYQWESAPTCAGPFTNVTGATSPCLNRVVTSTTVFRAKVTGTCGTTLISDCKTITVAAPVTISSQPANKEICESSNTSFTVTGTSNETIIYQWQVSTDGGTSWNNLAGTNSNTLSLPAVSFSMNNYRYRVVLTTTTCATPVNSADATLAVKKLPVVGLTASPLTSLLPGQTSVLTASPSSTTGGVITTTWLLNGNTIPVTGNSLPVNVEKLGDYQVRIQESFTSGLVCSNQSSLVKVEAAISKKLFIFPSPNDGQFTVSYYNSTGTNETRTVTVFDAKGSKVYAAKFTITGPYTLLPIDMRPALTGIYFVVVGDKTGKKLAEGKLLVH